MCHTAASHIRLTWRYTYESDRDRSCCFDQASNRPERTCRRARMWKLHALTTAFTYCLSIDRVESKMTPNSLTLSTIAKLASPTFRVSVERLTNCCRVPNAIASVLL